MLSSHWGRAATGSVDEGSLQSCPLFVTLQTMACQASLSGRGFSRQEYSSILTNTSHHTLLECYISCYPSRQLPWVPGAAGTRATEVAAPPPHLALTGAHPSPPGQPQEQTPVGNPHAEVEIKPQLKPRVSMTKEEDLKPSYQLYKLQIKSAWSTRQTLCLWSIWKLSLRAPTKENALVLISVDTGGKNTHRSRTRLESELPPQQVQRSVQCWRAS